MTGMGEREEEREKERKKEQERVIVIVRFFRKEKEIIQNRMCQETSREPSGPIYSDLSTLHVQPPLVSHHLP